MSKKESDILIDIEDQQENAEFSKLHKAKTVGALIAVAIPGTLAGFPILINKKLSNKLVGNEPGKMGLRVLAGAAGSAAFGFLSTAMTSIVGIGGGLGILGLSGITICAAMLKMKNQNIVGFGVVSTVVLGASGAGIVVGTAGLGLGSAIAIGSTAGIATAYLGTSSIAAVHLLNERFRKTRYDISGTDIYGKTLLHYMVIDDNKRGVELLFENPQIDSIINIYDDDGDTAFMIAKYYQNQGIISLFEKCNKESKAILEEAVDESAKQILPAVTFPRALIKLISSFALGGEDQGRGSR